MSDFLTPEQKRFLASQILGQDEDRIEEGIYTLVFTEYTRERLAELHKYHDEIYQIRAERTRDWTRCPACNRELLKKELLRKGCYLCGWRGTEEEAENEGPGQLEEPSTLNELQGMSSFKVDCPECGTRVIREQLAEKGCYICGWKPR